MAHLVLRKAHWQHKCPGAVHSARDRRLQQLVLVNEVHASITNAQGEQHRRGNVQVPSLCRSRCLSWQTQLATRLIPLSQLTSNMRTKPQCPGCFCSLSTNAPRQNVPCFPFAGLHASPPHAAEGRGLSVSMLRVLGQQGLPRPEPQSAGTSTHLQPENVRGSLFVCLLVGVNIRRHVCIEHLHSPPSVEKACDTS